MSARLTVLSAILAAAMALPAAAVRAQTPDPQSGTIAIVGEAEQGGAPDIAFITLGVSRDGETASAALRATSQAMREVIERVRKRGVEPRDIQTGSLSLSPRYRQPRGDERRTIIGYVASNQLTLRSRDIAALGSLLDDVVSAGSNEIRGLSFDVADRAKLLDEARVRAVEDAKRKASLYAEAAGIKLGDVVSVQEESGAMQPRPLAARSFEAGALPPVPIEAGEVGLRARVRIVWRIAR
jgi:uncharacterized protein YggE